MIGPDAKPTQRTYGNGRHGIDNRNCPSGAPVVHSFNIIIGHTRGLHNAMRDLNGSSWLWKRHDYGTQSNFSGRLCVK